MPSPTPLPPRFALGHDGNPWTPIGDLQHVMMCRGAIVSAEAEVHSLLTRLLFRLSHTEPYLGLRKGYMTSIKERLACLESWMDIEGGPLHYFAPIIRQLLKRLAALAQQRNMMAHAAMQILPRWGVTFVDVVRDDFGGFKEVRSRYTMHQIMRMAREATKLSRACHRYFYRLEAAGLPPLPDGQPSA